MIAIVLQTVGFDSLAVEENRVNVLCYCAEFLNMWFTYLVFVASKEL